MSDRDAIIAEGRRVIAIEAAAVAALEARVGDDFERACRLVAGANGRIITCGIGKSGHIARKLAGTLTSTGTPATFLHPVEALHGDLGLVGADDVAVIFSKSGASEELTFHARGWSYEPREVTEEPPPESREGRWSARSDKPTCSRA